MHFEKWWLTDGRTKCVKTMSRDYGTAEWIKIYVLWVFQSQRTPVRNHIRYPGNFFHFTKTIIIQSCCHAHLSFQVHWHCTELPDFQRASLRFKNRQKYTQKNLMFTLYGIFTTKCFVAKKSWFFSSPVLSTLARKIAIWQPWHCIQFIFTKEISTWSNSINFMDHWYWELCKYVDRSHSINVVRIKYS